jgi:adenylate cyclase
VYAEIPPARCATLHQRIGEALETAYGERATDIAPQLAAHFRHSRDHVRALRHLVAAGRRARSRFGVREAIGYLEEALALLPLLPERSERHRWELQVRLALGRALGDISFATQSVRENYERVSELSAALGAASELFEALYARWYLHALRSDREETIALAHELSNLAQRTGSSDDGITADSALVRTAYYDGRFADVRRHMQSLLARPSDAVRNGNRIEYGADPVIAATMHCAAALWCLGEVESARTSQRGALERARECGSPFTLSAITAQAALLELFNRNGAEGARLAAEAATLAAEQGFAFWHAFASALVGFAEVRTGRAAAGVEQLSRALDALHATDTRFFTAYVHAFLAEGCLLAGTFSAGLAFADAGIALTEATLDRGYAPELWRLKGELLLASTPVERGSRRRSARDRADANWPDAERCLRRALELARASEARSLELRAATSLARAGQAHGSAAAAHAPLAEICDWFANRLVTPDLLEARALLGELETARPFSRSRSRVT